MSAAIPGHGKRAAYAITPSCKCGWRGTACGPGEWAAVDDAATAQFERHKQAVRRDTGYVPKGRAETPARRLRVVR